MREKLSEKKVRNDSIYVIFEEEKEPLEMDADLKTMARYRQTFSPL